MSAPILLLATLLAGCDLIALELRDPVRLRAEALCPEAYHEACVGQYGDRVAMGLPTVLCVDADGNWSFREPGLQGVGTEVGDRCGTRGEVVSIVSD